MTGLEKSLAADEPRALIQAATGAGKTFTACTFSYRLLAHARFRRILFLADRANLVRQAREEFESYRPPGAGRSFTELYNVQRLGSGGLDKDASVVIATIQRVFSVLTGHELAEEDDTLDDPDLLPPPDEIAAEIVENLEAALDRFRKVALSLQTG